MDERISGEMGDIGAIDDKTKSLVVESKEKIPLEKTNEDVAGTKSEDKIKENAMETGNSKMDAMDPKIPSSCSINKKRAGTSSVFPVGCMGCRDVEENVEKVRLLEPCDATKDKVGYIDQLPRKRHSNTGYRNPVTGAGIEQVVRRPSNRRKDGNPLLGTGYEVPTSKKFLPGDCSTGM